MVHAQEPTEVWFQDLNNYKKNLYSFLKLHQRESTENGR